METICDGLAMQTLMPYEVDDLCDALRIAMRTETERQHHGGEDASLHAFKARRFKGLLQAIRPKHFIDQ